MTKTKFQLLPEWKQEVYTNPALVGVVALKSGKSIDTIKRWCRNNDERLTMSSILEAIKDFKGLPKKTSLIEEVV